MNAVSFFVENNNNLESQLLANINSQFAPTLALCYCDDQFDIESALGVFKKHNIAVVGCSSSGEISNGEVGAKSLSIMLMDMDTEHFSINYFADEGNVYTKSALATGQAAKKAFENPAMFVYSAGVGVDGVSMINDISKAFEGVVPIYGGQAGDNFKFEKTFVFTSDGTHDNGIASITFNNSKIAVNGQTYSGWTDLGKTHTITKADNNILYEIDGKPALDLFNSYFKNIEYQKQLGSDELYTMPGIFPLKIQKNDGVELLRSAMIFDFKNKALILAGGVEENAQFKFCPTPDFEVVNNTVDSYNNFGRLNKDVDAVILHSCAGRHFAFGPMLEDEVEGIHNIWEAPSIGFMSYGEFGNPSNKEKSEFHNVTCSLVTLKEI